MNKNISIQEYRRNSSFKRIRKKAINEQVRVTSFIFPNNVLPDFILLGVMRGGTSSFYEQLTRHPQVLPARVKEIDFFDAQFHKGLNYYMGFFPRRYELAPDKITGEASPTYIYYPPAIPLIAKTLPNCKFILLLRNPVDRAISHYFLMRQRFGFPGSVADVLNPNNLAHSTLHTQKRIHENPANHLERGLYLDQIKRLHQHFPEEQTLILRSEDYYANPEEILQKAVSFLGVKPELMPVVPLFQLTRPERDVSIPAGILDSLKDFYKPHNEALYEYLDRDFGW